MSVDQHTTDAVSGDPRDTRRRKIRALLAGGLVLGIGAAVTLAAWTDNVFGEAEFSAENWNVQGDFSADGSGAWAEYATDGTAGTFTYTTGFDALSPGTTVYSPVALRVGTAAGAGGAYDANVTLLGATNPGGGALGEFLRYTVSSGVSATDCNSGTLAGGTAIVAPDSTLDTGSAANAVTLPLDGAAVPLCFAVTLPQTVAPDVVAGQTTGRVVWQFEATAVV